MPESAQGIRGIRTNPIFTGDITAAETTWVQTETLLGTWISNETPSGTPTGTDGTDGLATYTIANAPTSTAVIWLYKNGVLQNYGSGNDYTISITTITFNSGAIPISGDVLRITYRK